MPRPFHPLSPALAALLIGTIADSAAGDFNAPVRVIGTKDLVAGPGITPGDLLELRVGTTGDDTRFAAAAVLRGPGNTTALVSLDVRRGRPGATPTELELDAIPQNVLTNVQVFSLGGGCRRGATTVFPFVRNQSNNFRPYVLQVTAGVPSVSPLAVSGSDQVHAIECASDPNGQDIYFLSANATRARAELWKTAGAGTPKLVYDNLVSVNSPFTGGIRPLLVRIDPVDFAGTPGTIVISYSLTNGGIRVVSLELNALNVALVCTLLTETPPPTAFTVVRDGRILAARGGGPSQRIASVGDFDRNGVAELIASPTDTCSPATVSKGSASGGNGYNFTGYGSVANPDLGWGYVGNGNGMWRYDFANGATQSVATPTVGPGGPFDFIGGRDAETGTFGFLAMGSRPGFPSQLRIQAFGEVQDADRFRSGFEGAAFERWTVTNQ